MELKAFKGMPHEFGGIDYTEGSEVEGGEFAVQIGKSGNEYIFDKNSSEGERLSKEYKKLDKNGRLTEDDPLALEAFDQIAREEALKHAQRSVNEKGVDPFRNMYEQGGQAANGGVKYATGGPIMNPAEVPNVNPGANFNTSMSYVPKTAEEYFREQTGADRIRSSFGTQTMRERPTSRSFKEIGAAKEAGLLIGDIFFGYPMASFTGKSFSETVMADQGYSSSDATKRAVGDDTMTGTAFGYGQMQSQNVISNMGAQVLGSMADGGAMPKDKYAQGGAKDIYQMGGGMPWLQMVKAIKGVKDSTAQIAGSAMDQTIADKMGEEYITDKITGPRQTTGGGNLAAFGNIDNFNPKKSELPSSPEGTVTYDGMSYSPEFVGPFPMDATVSQGGTEVPILKNGGAKPIYGYYANGGGKSYTDKIKEAEDDLNQSLGNPMNKAFDDFSNELQNNPRLRGDDMYLDPYRHGMAGYYTADAMKKKMPSWMPESVANKLAIAGSTIAGVGHEFAAPATDRMGLVDALTEAGQDAYNNYVGASMIEDVLFDREARQLMLNKIRDEETYPGVVVSDTDPYNLPKDVNDAVDRGLTFDQIMDLEKRGLIDLTDLKKFQDGGGKKKEDEDSFTDKLKGYVKDFAEPYVEFSERNRGVADALLPPHAAQYLYTMFGGTEPFTEKQLSDEKISTAQDVLENRTVKDKWKDFVTKESKGVAYDDETNLGYDDYNRFDAISIYDIFKDPEHFIKALTHDPSILKFLIGKGAVQETDDAYIIQSDYDFAKEKAWKDLEGGGDYLAYLWNMSPFADTEAMSVQKGSKAPINITIPKRKMEAKKVNPYYNKTSSYPGTGF